MRTHGVRVSVSGVLAVVGVIGVATAASASWAGERDLGANSVAPHAVHSAEHVSPALPSAPAATLLAEDTRLRSLVLSGLRPGMNERVFEILFTWENADRTARDDFHLFFKVPAAALMARRFNFLTSAVGYVLRFRSGAGDPAPEPFFRSTTTQLATETGNGWRIWFDRQLYFEWDRIKPAFRGLYATQGKWVPVAGEPLIQLKDWNLAAYPPAPAALPAPVPPTTFPFPSTYPYPNPYPYPYPYPNVGPFPRMPMSWPVFP